MPFARLATATTPTSHLGLGLAAVGRPGYINLGREKDLGERRTVETLRTRTHELLDAAYAHRQQGRYGRALVRYWQSAWRGHATTESLLGAAKLLPHYARKAARRALRSPQGDPGH